MRTLLLCALLLGGCATVPAETPHRTFLDRLSPLCGKAFEGRITSPPVEADRDFAGKHPVMHVRECSAETIRIPFHVGENRSRTWVVTRTPQGLRLKHDHRHEDGSEDKLTQYGGNSAIGGTAARQEFPVDSETRALFEREGIPQSLANVWALEIDPARNVFAYELRRPNRFFRVEFDLSRPVAPPPPPWGDTR